MKKVYIIVTLLLIFNIKSYGYNAEDVDLYNHSNQHGVVYKAEDKRSYYKEVPFTTIKTEQCGKKEYKKVKKVSKILKEKEQKFWDYKNCMVSHYEYKSNSIIDVYNNYRFDLNKRLMNMKDYQVLDNIVSYLPMNIKQGSNYLYYLGMRNNIVEWSDKNKSLHIILPIMFSGLITNVSIKDNSNIIVEEIFLYDR